MQRTYNKYTLPDYRQQKQFGYVELGTLGPGDPSPELVVKVIALLTWLCIIFVYCHQTWPSQEIKKFIYLRALISVLFRVQCLISKLICVVGHQREKLAQRKEFGRHARSCNIMSHVNPTVTLLIYIPYFSGRSYERGDNAASEY